MNVFVRSFMCIETCKGLRGACIRHSPGIRVTGILFAVAPPAREEKTIGDPEEGVDRGEVEERVGKKWGDSSYTHSGRTATWKPKRCLGRKLRPKRRRE